MSLFVVVRNEHTHPTGGNKQPLRDPSAPAPLRAPNGVKSLRRPFGTRARSPSKHLVTLHDCMMSSRHPLDSCRDSTDVEVDPLIRQMKVPSLTPSLESGGYGMCPETPSLTLAKGIVKRPFSQICAKHLLSCLHSPHNPATMRLARGNFPGGTGRHWLARGGWRPPRGPAGTFVRR